MIAWLETNGSITVLLVFLVMFVAFGVWAYVPANKRKMEHYGHIPLKETHDGE